jgi:hypothetical protein
MTKEIDLDERQIKGRKPVEAEEVDQVRLVAQHAVIQLFKKLLRCKQPVSSVVYLARVVVEAEIVVGVLAIEEEVRLGEVLLLMAV